MHRLYGQFEADAAVPHLARRHHYSSHQRQYRDDHSIKIAIEHRKPPRCLQEGRREISILTYFSAFSFLPAGIMPFFRRKDSSDRNARRRKFLQRGAANQIFNNLNQEIKNARVLETSRKFWMSGS
jgi:hypothetical protein